MGVVKRAEVILMLEVGFDTGRFGSGYKSRRSGCHYPQGEQAVNILTSRVWLTAPAEEGLLAFDQATDDDALARKNHPNRGAPSSLRARRLLKRRCAPL